MGSNSEYKVGDKFDIKQGIPEEDWPECGHGGEGTLARGSTVTIADLDYPKGKNIIRVVLKDSDGDDIHRNFGIDPKPFSIYVANGLFIPVGSAAMPERKKVEPGMLDNRRNTGLCPCCSTQTVSFGMFSGFPSRDFVCPKCKM